MFNARSVFLVTAVVEASLVVPQLGGRRVSRGLRASATEPSIWKPIGTLASGVGGLLFAGTCALRLSHPGRSTGEAAWAATTTLTGAGFGDVCLRGSFERFVGCFLACSGVALLSCLASALVAAWTWRPRSRRLAWPALVGAHLTAGAFAIQFTEGLRFDDALYLSIMTATNVGPGDVVPTSAAGRLATAMFSMASSIIFARLVGALALVPIERWRRRILDTYGTVLTAESLARLARGRDARHFGLSDDDSYVTRDQFTLLALINQRLVSVDDIQAARAKFDQLDRDRTGKLHQADLDILELDRMTAMDFFEIRRPRRPPPPPPRPRRRAEL